MEKNGIIMEKLSTTVRRFLRRKGKFKENKSLKAQLEKLSEKDFFELYEKYKWLRKRNTKKSPIKFEQFKTMLFSNIENDKHGWRDL